MRTTRPRTPNAGSSAAARHRIPPLPSEGRDIVIRGARVHNLKNIELTLPRNKLIVLTGVSGSGKSSLAFDTIYAEGQRRYVESLSAYARQFLERMDKPDVDLMQGISPAIAIEQKTTSRNPRSTVATTTEVYDYLRLLFGRLGRTTCWKCGKEVTRDTVSTVTDEIARRPDGTKVYIAFPMHDHPGRSVSEELEALKKRGFFRILAGRDLIDLHERTYAGRKKEEVLVLVDRLVHRAGDRDSLSRIADSLEIAFEEGEGHAIVQFPDSHELRRFTRHLECADDGIMFEDPDPRLFSFNNPVGACPACQGFGRSIGIDLNLVVPDPRKTIRQGAIQPWTFPRWREYLQDLLRIAPRAGVPVNVPFSALTPEQLNVVLHGYDGFDGIYGFFRYIEKKLYKIHYRVLLSRYRGYTVCSECGGSRLRKDALYIRVGGKTIHDVVRMTITEARRFFEAVPLTRSEQEIGARILEEIRKRLAFLDQVGIGYLTLDRLSMTLSGGESQRINLATSLGSSLVGALYVLDEPSIGLHPRDNQKLIGILRSLRDVGNTVLVVEHDEEMIRSADVVVDLGPRAGEQGGEVMFVGPPDALERDGRSLTGEYLRREKVIPTPRIRRQDTDRSIFIRGATAHNLREVDVRIPLGMFVCVTGVSGSGKSTLVHDVLYANLRKLKGGYDGTPGACEGIAGAEFIDGVELVDQSPIGRSPRSNPLTYLKIFDLIRDLLAHTPAARLRGYKAGHFSFNVPGGRCETCEGDGVQKIEMQFLADVYLPCESCKGKRFKQEILEVRYRGKNVDDILNMTVTEAMAFFPQAREGERVARRLKVLDDVGLGYLRLGQSATTLSGGEAQRMKLAFHLAASEREGRLLFLFDEPTTGLHFDDVAKLLSCFHSLLEAGHSVLVIEHNMHVVKSADFVIDLGPEGGEAGGTIVATGPPEEIARSPRSHTGRFLRPLLSS